MATLKTYKRPNSDILTSTLRGVLRLRRLYELKAPAIILEQEKRLIKQFLDELPANPPEIVEEVDRIQAAAEQDEPVLLARAIELFKVDLPNVNWDAADMNVQQKYYAMAVNEKFGYKN